MIPNPCGHDGEVFCFQIFPAGVGLSSWLVIVAFVFHVFPLLVVSMFFFSSFLCLVVLGNVLISPALQVPSLLHFTVSSTTRTSSYSVDLILLFMMCNSNVEFASPDDVAELKCFHISASAHAYPSSRSIIIFCKHHTPHFLTLFRSFSPTPTPSFLHPIPIPRYLRR